MAFLLILDREHKALWVKTKNRSDDNNWFLPEVEDPVNKPSNRLNVELLAKQAFIPLKSILIGQKTILDIFHNEQQLYIFLCLGKESTEVLFDLTKFKNIQWMPINFINESESFSSFIGKSILDAYYDLVWTDFQEKINRFHIIKSGYGRKDTEEHNNAILEGRQNILVELKEYYDLYHQPIPENGDHALLNSWKGLPLAALEITGVTLDTFDKITDFLDKLENAPKYPAQNVAEQYKKTFLKWCKKNNKQFSDQKPVIISQFKIVRQFKEKKTDYLNIT